MKTTSKYTLSFAAAALMLFATARPASAQSAASVKGHANNPLMQPLAGDTVKLTTDRTTDDKARIYPYSFTVNQNGDFSGTGIVPNANYTGFLVGPNGDVLDFIDHLSFTAGQTTTVDFDMSRKEAMDRMSPAERARLEDYKKKNAATMAANAKVNNLNALLTKARDEMKDNPDAAIADMLTATQAKPDEPILWITLGQANEASADAAYAATKKSGPPTDPAIVQKYQDALAAFQKCIDLDTSDKRKPTDQTPLELGTAYNQLGQINSRLGNMTEATTAYDNAAKAHPASAGTYFYNEAATFLNTNKNDEAAAAADKAIAADPTRADTYYIKGQALIQKASVDPNTNKITAPPGCVEAYQKYLELAPTGPHANDVKGILSGIGASVASTYKAAPAPKKK